jgi:thiamine kinase-like enzyme
MDINFLRDFEIFSNVKPTKMQGLNSSTYVFQKDNKKYIIRLFKNSDINRKTEFELTKKAYYKNIAPKPLFLDCKNNLMVLQFLEGKHYKKLSKPQIQNLARSVKKLHSIKCKQKPYDIVNDFNEYKKLLNLPFQAGLIFKAIKKVQKDYVLCHHDLNPNNILFCNEGIKFIDWEFARVNDRYFDLACIAVEFKLNKQNINTLVRSYFKNKRVDFKKLHLYMKAYIQLSKLWLLKRQFKHISFLKYEL